MSYKTQCPNCGGNNFYVTEHNGLGYCFSPTCGYTEHNGVAGANGERITLKRSPLLAEIREAYKRMAEYYHSNITGEALSYLYQRGYTDKTIEDLKIGFCPPDKSVLYRTEVMRDAGLATYTGEAFLADRIIFPYISRDGTITDLRGRSIVEGEELKYKSPHGTAFYRGADFPYNYFLHKKDTIIITEGEIKAGIGYQYGYNIMALPGMGSWRNGFKQREGQEVILLFDTQDSDIMNIRRAIIKAAGYIDTVKVATLPDMGRDKMDIDTLLLIEDGKEWLDIVVNAAIPFYRWLEVS